MSDDRTVGEALSVTVEMRRRRNPSMGGPTEFDRRDAAHYLEALGIPVDFPAADLPRAIAAWKRLEADLNVTVNPDGSKRGHIDATAIVADTAYVGPNARVCGNARVLGNARVDGNAKVLGNAKVSGDARVSDTALVDGNAWVVRNALVSDNARVTDNVLVTGNARVYGDAWVAGSARVDGNAQISGRTLVYGNAWVDGDAWVSADRHVVTIGPVGSEDEIITVHRTRTGHLLHVGCWRGHQIDELADEVQRRAPQHADEYAAVETLCRLRIAEWETERGESDG